MDIRELLGFPIEELEGRVLMGDKKAEAYMWITRYVDNLNSMIDESNADEYAEYTHDRVTFDELIEHANSHQGEGWGDYIVRGGVFEGVGIDPVFWDKYAILRDIPRDEVNANSFFSCSC